MKASGIFGLLFASACAVAASDPQPGDEQKNPAPKPSPAPPNMQADSGAPEMDAADPPDPGGISGGGYGFTTTQQMFAFINQIRQQYSNHIPYDGYPFQGMNASAMTWSTVLASDASLDKMAQDEADRLAKGGQPKGAYFPFMNDGNGEGFYTGGLDTAAYFLATRADGHLPEFVNVYGVKETPHHAYMAANGFFRMGVAYQTGAGAFAKKSKLGVGATEGGDKITWWVLIFG